LNRGTEEQKRRYLPRMAKGELVGAIAMTEPGAGSDLQAIRPRAERHGNQYALNGSKTLSRTAILPSWLSSYPRLIPPSGRAASP
jgi:acyl-CoA dehydrogenase